MNRYDLLVELDENRQEIGKIVVELETLLATNSWEFGSETIQRLRSVIARLRRVLAQ